MASRKRKKDDRVPEEAHAPDGGSTEEVGGTGDDREVIVMEPAPEHKPLAVDDLRWRCDPKSLPFETTDEVEPATDVIGQDAAMEALRFGLETRAPGQNIFVRGLAGTGRMTLVRRLLEDTRLACPLAQDRCYVHNFSQPSRPRLITLPRGDGPVLARHVDDLVDFIRDDLEGAVSSDAMRTRRAALDRATKTKIDEVVKPFEESVREAGLALVSVQVGPATQAALLPLVEGKAVSPEEWEKLRGEGAISDEAATDYQDRVASFQDPLREMMTKTNELQRHHADAVRDLRHEAVRLVLEGFVECLKVRFTDSAVATFLDELVTDVASIRAPAKEFEDDEYLRRYRVNVLMSHADDLSCSINVENTPTMSNLLGSIDQKYDGRGRGQSDHLMVRAGSLLRADGGYLILEAREVLREPGAWKVLLRTLRTGRLEIMPPEMTAPWWGPYLTPEPIEVNVKVILLGDAEIYYQLDAYDPDFPYLFKVLADFGQMIDRDEHGIAQYSAVLARIAKEEDLSAFSNSAVAALVEHGARIAGGKNDLTTRFGRLADIAHEAAYVAGKERHDLVNGDDVRDAIRRTKKRAELPSKRFREMLADGTIRVATTGTKVGQVNGLAVTHAGPLVYGFPARITASIGPGSAGVINIEGESNLSGSVHTKGFHILSGLLRSLLKTEHPLAFHASIALEQSYGGIDGDSASGAEVCCLISALTEVPLRQDLAMTGAVDQVGNILAIGAANEKVEGFFDTCFDLGLTGTQGVIIPKSCVRDLMLRHDVVEACADGKFHVYSVDTIHEALELLTSTLAGCRDETGVYPEGSLLGLAVGKAFEYWVKAIQGLESFSFAQEEAPVEEPDAG